MHNHVIQLALIVIGIFAIVWAISQDNDFFNGRFILSILAVGLGLAAITAGMLWFLIAGILGF